MNPLRNRNINYCRGWFFVTIQVAMNKSVFGVIADKKLILNALGNEVKENLAKLGDIFSELYVDTFDSSHIPRICIKGWLKKVVV